MKLLRQNDFAPPGERKQLMGYISTATKRNRKSVRYKIDTGADNNLLSVAAYRKLFPNGTREQLNKKLTGK